MGVIVVILALVALAWVLAATRTGGALAEPPVDDDALNERKVAALSALADLDEELAVGKITPADHAALRATYEADAVGVLHEIDEAAER